MFEITLKFLSAVKENNTTHRLHAHRDLYQQEKKRFEQFVSSFLVEAKKLNPLWEDLTPKDCIFRFNRDLRFSRDGKPYKENFGAVFTFGGKKSDFPCFYFHLQPGASFWGGGVYMPTSHSQDKVRVHLLQYFHQRKKITQASDFKKYYGEVQSPHQYKSTLKFKQLIASDPELVSSLSPDVSFEVLEGLLGSSGGTLSNDNAEKILSQLAYYKDWIFEHPLSDQELMGENVLEKMLEAYQLLVPVLEFFEQAYGA